MAGELDAAYRRRFGTVFEWLAPGEGERVLDAGCGRGFQLGWLRRLCAARLYGIDSDAACVREASLALSDVALVRADAAAAPFRPGSFDKVVLSEVLEHVDDDLAALRAVAALVRPGGLVAVTVPHADYPFWWDPVNKSLEALGARPLRRGPLAGIWTGHRRLYRADTLRQRVSAAGLEVLEMRRCTHHCVPFAHHLFYGLGKPLLLSGWLPEGLSQRLDRRTVPASGPRRLDLAGLALRLVEWIDRANAASEPPGRTCVNLCLLARRPVPGNS